MLIGIVVTNAIVLVDLVNQYRERGMTVRDAIVHGARATSAPDPDDRARDDLRAHCRWRSGITGHGGFISQPLAIVVIGGLVSSTAADARRAADAVLPRRGCEGAAAASRRKAARAPASGESSCARREPRRPTDDRRLRRRASRSDPVRRAARLRR